MDYCTHNRMPCHNHQVVYTSCNYILLISPLPSCRMDISWYWWKSTWYWLHPSWFPWPTSMRYHRVLEDVTHPCIWNRTIYHICSGPPYWMSHRLQWCIYNWSQDTMLSIDSHLQISYIMHSGMPLQSLHLISWVWMNMVVCMCIYPTCISLWDCYQHTL